MYAADGNNESVSKLAPSGALLGIWNEASVPNPHPGIPSGVAVTHSGPVYAAFNNGYSIERLSAGLTPSIQLAQSGTDIVLDGAGNLYVADGRHDRILKLSPGGIALASWGSFGTAPGKFNQPSGIALDAHGNIYVADTGNDRIQKLSPAGIFLRSWGATGSRPGLFHDPAALALDSRGDMYVADAGNNRIQEHTGG
ncbi:MAG: NHL repeat-containing protein [Chloroflexota bacterium]